MNPKPYMQLATSAGSIPLYDNSSMKFQKVNLNGGSLTPSALELYEILSWILESESKQQIAGLVTK